MLDIGRPLLAQSSRAEQQRDEAIAEVQRLRKEIAELGEQARTATILGAFKRKLLPARWVAASCDHILATPIPGNMWRIS